MRGIRKLVSIALAAVLAFPVGAVGGLSDIHADAAQTVSISPLSTYEINEGKFEGWGTSLCWWANRVGYSDSLAQQAADVFYGDDGLRLNIARFNIGGGDDPTHHHITRTDSNMPGYTDYSNGKATYNWDKDFNQRNVLLRAIKACGDDMIVEMFSNSPPFYMCKSGCSTGNTNPGANNLKDDMYDDFADYLAEVCYHYEHDWGVDIQSVEAMNEPYTNFWGANSPKQEGCHFDLGNSESTAIVELQRAMKAKGLDDVMIVGTDETSIDTQIDAYNKLSPDAKNAISRIDTHTYAGSRRSDLKDTALAAGKNLWMSEVDGGATQGKDNGEMGAALWLAGRITADLNGLNASAWILWQVIDNHISSVGYNGNKDKGMVNVNGGYWGVAVADHDKDTIILTKKYYAFGQYTRFIRPGMVMLNSSGTTVAAYDPDKGRVVIVAYNDQGSARDLSFDLSGFGAVGEAAQCIRTSASESWKDIGNVPLSSDMLNVSVAPNSVTTYIIDGCKGTLALDSPIELDQSKLSGTKSWKEQGSTDFYKAFDGKTTTYFDGLGGGWVQADLGDVYDLTAIGYCPRQGYEYRMADGMFQLSEDGVNWHTAYTISGSPSFAMHYATRLEGSNRARYVRYAVPEGAPKNAYNKDDVYCCNLAELKIYGSISPLAKFERLSPAKLTGTDSWKSQGSTDYSKAFDGDTATSFDGVGNGWVQADLGGLRELHAISYCPRKGYEGRMLDSYFEGSADGETWTRLHTVKTVPGYKLTTVTLDEAAPVRYVRFAVPEGKPNNGVNTDDVYCCNIAEIELYGLTPEVPDEPETPDEPEMPDAQKGDVNKDSAVDVLDLVTLQKYIHGVGALPSPAAADLTEDGDVDVFDLALLKRILLAN